MDNDQCQGTEPKAPPLMALLSAPAHEVVLIGVAVTVAALFTRLA
jgi:hypothetical protein